MLIKGLCCKSNDALKHRYFMYLGNKLTVCYLKTRCLKVKLAMTSQLSHVNRDSAIRIA